MALPSSVWFNIANDAAIAQEVGLARTLTNTLDVNINGRRLGEMLDSGRVNIAGIEAAVNFEKLERQLERDIFEFNLKSAKKAARESAKTMGATPIPTEFLEREARRRARSVARSMSTETRRAMARSIRRMKAEGFSRREIIANARKLGGLNQQQANSVLSRMKALRESGASRARMDKEFDRLTRRQFRARGKLAAGHETKIGAEMGQDSAVAHAVDAGEIENVRQRWVSIPDGRRDKICKGLHGQTVALGEKFSYGGREYNGPPEPHLTCRCGKHVLFRTVPAERRVRSA